MQQSARQRLQHIPISEASKTVATMQQANLTLTPGRKQQRHV
jgi:hypothetical protein